MFFLKFTEFLLKAFQISKYKTYSKRFFSFGRKFVKVVIMKLKASSKFKILSHKDIDI